ncbi:MAC/Perforin domain-containing protein [Besnoitia besnoiti]|uniref:MAC/Perforin domain-containing protein n=1 Tax=Besnoitia besnoiti TaxID=94643 RepID=A0A2A9M1G3_BESBE|nr:MAC/Perforin domain-containing protein [Besnoitia besnoiti]PFH31084.1 MAC/Perforin domain-containing protein [Besnoitia besnoiti]
MRHRVSPSVAPVSCGNSRSMKLIQLLTGSSVLLSAGYATVLCALVALAVFNASVSPANGISVRSDTGRVLSEAASNVDWQFDSIKSSASDELKASGTDRSSLRSSIRLHDSPSGSARSLAQIGGDDFDLDLSWDSDDDASTSADNSDVGDVDSLEETSDKATQKEDDLFGDDEETDEDSNNFTASLKSDDRNINKTNSKSSQTVKDFFGTVPVQFDNVFKKPSPLADRFDDKASEDRIREIDQRRADRLTADTEGIRSRIGAEPLQNMYTRAVETSPSTNFLGIGYDSIKGNPIGDPEMMVDPGLRSPIIVFSFKQDENGVTNDLNYLQPLGAYTRPFSACRQSETVNELDTLADYQSQLSVDASLQGGDLLGVNSFSGSAGYNQFARDISSKETKAFMIKTYCIRYEAGIAQTESFKWNYTLAFQNAVEALPTTFDGTQADNACTVEQWRQDHSTDLCQNTNIPRWIRFIEQFGTHYTVRLFAGGKMTYKVTMKAADVKKLKKRGVDVKAQVKIALGAVGFGGSTATSSNKEDMSGTRSLNLEKEAIVIGGKPPADLSDAKAIASWADTVEALPMPVKIELSSLQNLLPNDKKEAFEQAVDYYGKAYGMSLMDIQSLEGRARAIQDVLRDTTQIAWGGAPPGFAMCPKGQVVLFGFAIKFNFKVPVKDRLAGYHLVACTAGREKCDGTGTWKEDNDDERIYVVCGPEVVNEFYQVVDESTPGEEGAEATCPEDTEIAFGFGLGLRTGFYSAENLAIEPCTAGQTSCTKNLNSHTAKTYVWMVCAEKTFPGIAQLHNVVAIGSTGKAYNGSPYGNVTLTCDANESVILGYALEAHTHLTLNRHAFRVCDKDVSPCELRGSGINKTVFGNDRHGLFGWLLCSAPYTKPAEDMAGEGETVDEKTEENEA